MKIDSYISLGNLFFEDNSKTILQKLNLFKTEESIRKILNEEKKFIFVRDLNLSISFIDAKGSGVECFEIDGGNAFYEEIDLFGNTFDNLLDIFQEKDEGLIKKEGGFDSPLAGIGVYCDVTDGEYTKYPQSVIVFRKEYLEEDTPSVDEIIKYFLGYNPLDESQFPKE